MKLTLNTIFLAATLSVVAFSFSFAQPGTVSTIAGSGVVGYVDGPPASAQFRNPYGVAMDASGNIIIADRNNARIRKIDPAGNVTTIAGNGGTGSFNGPALSSSLRRINDIAIDGSGNIIIAAYDQYRIGKLDPSGTVSTIAGSGIAGYLDGPASVARFDLPGQLAIDGSGNIYVVGSANHVIRKIDPSGNVSTVAGTGVAGYADGPASTAQFNRPWGIAIDGSGNLIVSEAVGNRLRMIDPAGNVSTLAGTGSAGMVDGPAAAAQFNSPHQLAIDGSGNIYISDRSNHAIRMLDPSENVSTLTGTGTAGFADGPLSSALFSGPTGITIDNDGHLIIGDPGNQMVRRIELAIIEPIPTLGQWILIILGLLLLSFGAIMIRGRKNVLSHSIS